MNIGTPLYPYRVYALGGHVFKAYAPFKQPKEFWEHVKSLKADNKDFEAVTFTNARKIVEICFTAKDILGFDTAYMVEDGPMIIEDKSGKMEAVPYDQKKHRDLKVKPKQASVVNVGKTAKRKK